MILSLRHKFILVRGRKVGGTSVEMALSTLCGPEDIVSPMVPIDERARQELGGHCGNYSDSPLIERGYVQLVRETPLDQLPGLRTPPARFRQHMSLREIAEAFGQPIHGFRVICVERNPYARVISAINMARNFDSYKGGGEMAGGADGVSRGFDALGPKTLASLRNVDLYRDASGAIVAKALRYERLESDFAAFLGEIGVTQPVALPHAKKGLLSNRFDPREVFRRDQIDRINALFAEEFEAFGYARV